MQTAKPDGVYDAFVLKITPTMVSTTTLTLPSGTVTACQTAIFTATVAGPTGTTTVPTGTVTFLSGSTTFGTGTLNASGVATYTATGLSRRKDGRKWVIGLFFPRSPVVQAVYLSGTYFPRFIVILAAVLVFHLLTAATAKLILVHKDLVAGKPRAFGVTLVVAIYLPRRSARRDRPARAWLLSSWQTTQNQSPIKPLLTI